MRYFLEELKDRITSQVAEKLGVEVERLQVADANDKFTADLAIPVFSFATEKQTSPAELAGQIASDLEIEEAKQVEAVSGFINITLKAEILARALEDVKDWAQYGDNDLYQAQTVLIEHTDPNPFKQLHIGHVYSNSVGESLARLHEAAGAHVHRLSYHGDVGLHVAKAMWGIYRQLDGHEMTDIAEDDRANFLGRAYSEGAAAYESDEAARAEIDELNKKIYELEDEQLKMRYEIGKKWSFDYFNRVYKRLTVTFEKQYFESAAGAVGLKLVREHTPGVFEESDGAIIFDGEKHGEHTRVFISSAGLPTYEAKDLGLMKLKQADYPDSSLSIIITAEEQAAYFRVMLKAMEQIDPDLANKTRHIAHGEVRLPSGKMSSRTGDVVTAVSLLDMVENALKERNPEAVATAENTLGAIKYAFLKQNIGGNIVYDIDESISLEGQSGPYVQYAAVRVHSLLKKVEDGGDYGDYDWKSEHKLLFLINKYPEVVRQATEYLEPHRVAQFLYELARELNRYYEQTSVKDAEDGVRSARLFMLRGVRAVLEHGLGLLNIPVPERM